MNPPEPQPVKRVLFVCVGNAARSQMAEGWARHLGLDAESAGTTPAGFVAHEAIQAMAEKGIDISSHQSKMLDWDTLDSFDLTITMGCGVAEACPSLKTDEDWGLDDPYGQGMEAFRRVRDEVEARIRQLMVP